MKYILVANKKPIVLGRYGENEETTVRFSINTFFPDLADADFGLVHKRPGDAAPYPCVVNTFNGFIEWEIKSGDLANVGSGTAQLSAYKGGTVSKTEIFTTVILDSMGMMDPPDPKEDWVNAVLRAGLLASDSADRALNYANEAKEIKDGIGEEVNSYLEEAKESGEFDGPEGPAGYSPYITVTQIANGHRVEVANQSGTDSFDVLDGAEGPQGEEGYSPSVTIATIPGGHRVTITDADHPQGQSFDVMDGEDGEGGGSSGADGYSPTVSITTITGGHRVTITDVNGPHTYDVMDGTNGQDGVSPAVSISTITGGHRVTITDKTHPTGQSFDVMDGAEGPAYTLTAADKAEIVDDVLDALPIYNGGVT